LSLHASVCLWSDRPYTLVLSDSSPEDNVSNEARQWADQVGCKLVIDHSSSRRFVKEALNVALSKKEVADADLVIVTNDDVEFDRDCVSNLLRALSDDDRAKIAVGTVLPDPRFVGGRRRAGAWQMDVVARIAQMLPGNTARAEGAIWATRGSFAGTYRYPIGSGNIADDVELLNYISQNNFVALNVPEAVVYKIPPLGFLEFALQTQRFRTASRSSYGPSPSPSVKLRAFLINLMESPLGALFYVAYRILLSTGLGRKSTTSKENWDRASSTFR
jgi:hypothetical protein